MPFDFKVAEKALYKPKTTPSIIEVPTMRFIMVDGQGNPNTEPSYQEAVQILYGLSYAIRMNHKATLEYVVAPLEGLWSVAEDSFKGGGQAILDKDKFRWTMMIRQPDFVTEAIFDQAKQRLHKKKPALNIERAVLSDLTEGLCVQVMHLGPYDDEPQTVALMDQYALNQGYVLDMAGSRLHHEIYLSDPRKTKPEKLKTILRHPIREEGTYEG